MKKNTRLNIKEEVSDVSSSKSENFDTGKQKKSQSEEFEFNSNQK